MAWAINLGPKAKHQLEELDKQVARRISRFLDERVAHLENPRSIGEALKGTEYGDLWKYRVGDYRIITSIADKLVRILEHFRNWRSRFESVQGGFFLRKKPLYARLRSTVIPKIL
jgi:mRNA interferase RelE/StbE